MLLLFLIDLDVQGFFALEWLDVLGVCGIAFLGFCTFLFLKFGGIWQLI